MEVENAPKPESIKGKHFEYTLVFGQGPVQEREKVPQSGRQGLNFYSRMTSLAAAQMLKDGVTDKVILSGGATGARAGTPEAKTEAELMADIIRRKLTTLSRDGTAYVANGREIPLNDRDGNKRPKEMVDAEIAKAFSDKILIENEAEDTLQNFAFILNKYLDKPGQNKASMAMLGIGFHAKDTYNNTGVGRLEVLRDIFGLNGPVYSTEDVIRELLVEQDRLFPREELRRLAYLAENHDVSRMKSIQEQLLIEGLNAGEWTRILSVLENPDRVRDMIIRNPYVQEEFRKQFGMSKEDLLSIDFSELLDKVQALKVQGTPKEYDAVKEAIFEVLSEMRDKKGTDYLALYGKGTIPK